MKTVLMATAQKFWLDDRGDRRRTVALCRFIRARGFHLEVFFLGKLTDHDNDAIRNRHPGIVVHAPSPRPSGPTLSQRLARSLKIAAKRIKRFRRSAQAALERRVPAQIVPPLATIKRKLKSLLIKPRPPQPTPEKKPKPRTRKRHLSDYVSPRNQHAFRRLCRRLAPEIVLVEYVNLAYLIPGVRNALPKHAVTLIDTLDVLSQRCERFRAMGEDHWVDVTEQEERDALDLFDVIIAIQPEDAARFKRMLPHKRVITAMHATAAKRHPPHRRSSIALAYVATDGAANRRAIQHFLDETWPPLYERFGDKIQLNLAGRICDHFGPDTLPAGTRALGYVEDLAEVYGEAGIIVNPVAFGGGLKIKNVEALANGKPLVTTTVGAEGMQDGAGTAFLTCDSSDDMVQAVSRLIEDPDACRRLAEHAYRYALDHFTEETAYRELCAVLSDVDEPSRPPLARLRSLLRLPHARRHPQVQWW